MVSQIGFIQLQSIIHLSETCYLDLPDHLNLAGPQTSQQLGFLCFRFFPLFICFPCLCNLVIEVALLIASTSL